MLSLALLVLFFAAIYSVNCAEDYCIDLNATPLTEVDDESVAEFVKENQFSFLTTFDKKECETCEEFMNAMSDVADSFVSSKKVNFGVLDGEEYAETVKEVVGDIFGSSTVRPTVAFFHNGEYKALMPSNLPIKAFQTWIELMMYPIIWNANLDGAVKGDTTYLLLITNPIIDVIEDEETGDVTKKVSFNKLGSVFEDSMRVFTSMQAAGYNVTNAPFGLDDGEGIYVMQGDKVVAEYSGRLAKDNLMEWFRWNTWPSPVEYNKNFLHSLDPYEKTRAVCFLTGPYKQMEALKENEEWLTWAKSLKPDVWFFTSLNNDPKKKKEEGSDEKEMWEDIGMREHFIDVLCSISNLAAADEVFDYDFKAFIGADVLDADPASVMMDNLNSFVDAFFVEEGEEGFENKPERFFKSQDFGEEPREETGVTNLSAKSFLPAILGGEQDVLLFIYSASCQHCKKFQPTFDKIANLLYGDDWKNNDLNPGIMTAKIDHNANDGKHIHVTAVPDIRLYPRYSNSTEIDDNGFFSFEGDRTAGKVIRWLTTVVDEPINMPDLTDVMKKKKKSKKGKKAQKEEETAEN